MTYYLSTLKMDGRVIPAISDGQRHWDIGRLAPQLFAQLVEPSWMGVMDRWPDIDAALAEIAPQVMAQPPIQANLAPEDVLAPLLYPRKVVCTGANYREHLGEVGFSADFDKRVTRPSFFLKPPTTSVIGSGKSVQFPAQTRQFDWEIEMAVVIGRGGRH